MNMQSFTKAKLNLVLFSVLSLISFASFAADNSALNVFSSSATANGGQNYSLSLQTLILLTALSFLPTIVLMMTSFTRIIIVLSLLRQAIGAQSSPPNQILLGLALFLTFFIMSPVLDRVYSEAYKPLSENKITMQQALDKGSVPIREFMLKQTREADLAMFLNLAGKKVANPNEIPMSVLIPSFMTSELKTGFQIGFSIFIPFLVIDMVVASVLMAMGMMMLPPSIVSLPFKLMLFVLVDGWQLLIGSLANSFR
jgi:flagellar biosynthetic protein FliP